MSLIVSAAFQQKTELYLVALADAFVRRFLSLAAISAPIADLEHYHKGHDLSCDLKRFFENPVGSKP
jgi:hypothetical protein